LLIIFLGFVRFSLRRVKFQVQPAPELRYAPPAAAMARGQAVVEQPHGQAVGAVAGVPEGAHAFAQSLASSKPDEVAQVVKDWMSNS
jgi:flagellar biosynthesis/type III secretory pathway M-ring protein FliF/YscJ